MILESIEKESIKWANKQVKKLEWNIKHGEIWQQMQAKIKLQKIRSLSKEEYMSAAIASYRTHLDFIHNRSYN